jgi:ribosomal protein S18 acetylase RimI-like enzyme
MWSVNRLTDKAQILSFLESDRLYAAYAVGDLEPGMFEDCTWIGAGREGRLQSLALDYRGLDFPVLFLMGETDGLRAIFEDEGVSCPERAYFTCREEHLAMTHESYAWDAVIPMWRMVLRLARFRSTFTGVRDDCAQLSAADSGRLRALYALGGAGAFNPRQVRDGVFYGIVVGGQLVATAGTHLVASTYSVAAVGNVFTHPEHRRRGYATAATSAVVAELLERGIRDVVLNVGRGNTVAISIYERVGFDRYCPFLEGMALARGRQSVP